MYIPIGPSKKQLYKIILLLLCLLFGFKSCVKADVVYNGTISPTLARLRQAPSGQIDASFENNLAHIQLSGDNIKTSHTLSIFFNALTYHGYTGYRYKFSGYLNSYQWAYSTITAVDIQNGNGETIGVCEYTANGNQTQYQSFTLDCMVPSGLSYGAYANIIDFQFSTLGNTPENSTSFDIYISEKMAVYKIEDSNSQIANDTNDIKNNINSDNVDNNQANSFFNDFNSNTPEGLVSLINKPLNFLNGLYNTCSPISVHVPYFDFDLTLPCISSIHNGIFDIIIPIAKIIINGLLCYRLVLGFINVINKLKDPNDSDIEVVDL